MTPDCVRRLIDLVYNRTIWRSLLCLVLLSAFVDGPAADLVDHTRQPKGTTIVPDTFLRRWDPVTLFFDRSIGTAGKAEDHPERFVRLSPQHPGAYTWLDDRTLQFRPAEPWPPLARFTWKMGKRNIPLDTLVSAPVASLPANGATDLNPVEAITLTFSAPVDPRALKKMLAIELRPLPGIDTLNSQWLRREDFEIKVVERGTRDERVSYVINLLDPIPNGTKASVHLRLSLRDSVDQSFHRIDFATARPFEVESAGCPGRSYPITISGSLYGKAQAIQCNSGNRKIEVKFSSRLGRVDPIAARNLVHISPPVADIDYQIHGDQLTVSGDFKTDQLYQVNLEPSQMVDAKARKLHMNGGSELFLFFPVQSSFLQWQVGQGVMERFGPQMLPLKGRGFERLDLRIHPIDPLDRSFWPFPDAPVAVDEERPPEAPGEAPSPFKDRTRYISSSELRRQIKALGAPTISKIVATPLQHAGGAATFGLDMAPYFARINGKKAPGTYLVGMRRLDAGTGRNWVRVQVTDLSLSAINEPRNVRFLVSSLNSGRPVGDATIEIEGDSKTILKARTDASGQYDWTIPDEQRQTVRRIVVTKGRDVLTLDPTRAPRMYHNNLWQNDSATWLQWTQYLSRDVYDDAGTDVCHIFTDRPVYKPEDAVHIKGYIRNVRQGRFRYKTLSKPRIHIEGPGDQQWDYAVSLTPHGSYYLKFEEKNLPTGTYTAAFQHDKGSCGSVTFKKEAYRLPTFEVRLSGPQTSGLDDPFRIQLTAEYYAGGPVSQRPVAWRVTQFPYTWSPQQRQGFFYSTDTRFSNLGRFRSTPVVQQQGLTDTYGGASLLIDPTIEPTAQPRRYVIEATVTGSDDQTVTNTFQTVAVPPFVMGLKVPRYTRTLDPINAQILVADPGGEPVIGKAVTVRLLQRQWHSHLQSGDFSYGVAKYVTETVDENVFETSIRTAADVSTIELPIKAAGVYIVEVEAQDKLGRSQSVQVDFFAGGEKPVSWARPAAEVFKVTSDKDTYAPGEKATLILESPFQRATALAIVEQPDGRNRYAWVAIRGGKATYSVPIHKTDMPQLPVHFLLMRGRVAEAKPSNIDLGKPRTLAATMLIDVGTVENEIAMTLDYPEKVQPGDEIEAGIELKDHRGRPLDGEVTLWLVDQSVLALGKEQRIDLLPDFIRRRDSYTRLRDTRNTLLGYFPYQEEPGGGLASEMAEPAQLIDKVTVRKNFNPVPYFNPSIQVVRGKARVTIKMPDNLTNFKVRAKAVSGPDKYGFHKGRIAVRLPVIVQPALPRFVRPGDRFTAVAIGRVVEGGGGEGLAQIKVDGLDLGGQAGQAFTWQKDQPQRIGYELRVPTPGYTENGEPERTSVDVTIAVRRSADNARDAFRLRLPLQADRSAVIRRRVFHLTQKDTIKLDAIADAVREGTVNRSFLLSTQPELIRMAAGLNYLLEYPYGCTEQRVSRARAQLASRKFDALLYKAGGSTQREKVIQDTLAWIEQSQADSGLIGFWPGSPAYVSLTAWSLMFMVEARDAGFPIDTTVFDQMVAALKQALRSDYRHYISGESYAERSWALAALTRAGEADRSYAAELARKADYLNLESLAQVIVALSRTDSGSRRQLEALYKQMWDGIVFRLHQGREIYGGLQQTATARNALILPSETRTLAEVLRAAAMAPHDIDAHDPDQRKEVLIDAIVRLGKGDGWGSTNANAAALLSLADVLESTRPDQAKTVVEMRVGGASRQLSLGQNPIVHVATQNTGEVRFGIASGAAGQPLVLMSDTRYLPQADGSSVAANAAGFVVNRELLLWPDDKAPAKHFRLEKPGRSIAFSVGDIVEEHVEVVNPVDRAYVAVVIPLAAGMEPLNPALATAPPEATPRGQLTLNPSYTGLLDDSLSYYYDFLPKGTYHFYFRTRATIPGTFIQPAAYAEMMYDQTVNGNGSGARIVITQKTSDAARNP